MSAAPNDMPASPEIDSGAAARERLSAAIAHARDALLAQQHADGYWCYELEADCTIPAEYILMMHYMDEVDCDLERKIANFLRSQQADDGGWPLYTGGALDLSCTIKAYYALKLVGDSTDAPHMVKAREAILAAGGAARANVFTRIALAMFGQVPWRAVPYIPVEIMLLPRWFPFHLSKVSYWSRTVMVPLFILCTRKAKAVNPRNVDIRELFITPPEQEREYFRSSASMDRTFFVLDRIGRALDPLIPGWMRRWATRKAERWFIERLNGEDGLGAIFPAMVNSYEALALLGYPKDHPLRVTARKAIDGLLVHHGESTYCQPCVSPVWDTGLACLALEEEANGATPAVKHALDWLCTKQLLKQPGDWQDSHPDLPGGGWAFQFANGHYPDLDDTAVVAWAMHLARDAERYGLRLHRAANWLRGMQSTNGGFAAFDSDNEAYHLNHIPFADHGALLDPPTADVSGRCLMLFSLLQRPSDKSAVERVRAYLEKEQDANGGWFGRWGTNFIYGTWSVVVALEHAGYGSDHPAIRRAADWLKRVQRDDGGWGETNDSYADPSLAGCFHESTSFHTAWAMLALMACGEAGSEAVRRGAEYLMNSQGEDGQWHDRWFNAPGFPRVFYLRYHGYRRYFPLWALARHRNLTHAAP